MQKSSPPRKGMPAKGDSASSTGGTGGWLPSRDDFLKFPFVQSYHGVPRAVLEALLDEHVTCLAVLSLLNEKDASAISKKEIRQKEIEAVDEATKAVSKLYRKASAKFHPDRFGDTYRSEHELLHAAYDVLKDKDKRRYYVNSMCDVLGYIQIQKKTTTFSDADEQRFIQEAHNSWIDKNAELDGNNETPKTPGSNNRKPVLKIAGGISTRTPKRMIVRSILSKTSVRVALPALEPLYEFHKSCRQINILVQDGAEQKTIKTIRFDDDQDLAENHYIETVLTLQPGVHQLVWFALLELWEGSLTETPQSMATEVVLGGNSNDSLPMGKDLVFLARRRAGELRSVLNKQTTATSIDEIDHRMIELHQAVSKAHTIKSRLSSHLRANRLVEDTPELDKLLAGIQDGNLEMSRLKEQKETKSKKKQKATESRRLADKLEHGEGAAWMASVTSTELESINGSSNRLFQLLTEGKKSKWLSIDDPETLKVASKRTDLFTEKQCEKLCEVYEDAEAKFAEEAQKSHADEERKRADEELRQSFAAQALLMQYNAPVVLVHLLKDQSLNGAMGTYQGRAPHGRHRVRLYKDNRLLSLKEENICRYEDFLVQQDRANYEKYENDLASAEEESDVESVSNENQVTRDSGQATSISCSEAPNQSDFPLFRRVLSAPSSRLRFLIGRKRATLLQIEAQTGVRSMVISKEVVDGKQDVILTGDKCAVEKAEKLCMDILKTGTIDSNVSSRTHKENASTKNDGGIETVTIPIPQQVVNQLIGSKGANLARLMQAARGSKVWILDPVENGVRQARISGRPSSIKKAIKLIESFCEEKMPCYKTRCGLSAEGNSKCKDEQSVVVDETPRAPVPSKCSDDPTITEPVPATPEESVDPLLAFLLLQKPCLKGSPHDFYAWLLSEDVGSLEDLAEAVEDDDFVHAQMQANGLKGFKRAAFVKAIRAQTANQSPGACKGGATIPSELECPISHVLMVTDPVVASDGHVYERAAIEAWYRRSKDVSGTDIVRSPLTNEVLPNLNLTSVAAVRTLAREFSS